MTRQKWCIVQQIAEELGVSKTAVRKQIANLGLHSGLRKNGNQFAIDEEQEAQIIRVFGGKLQTENGNQFANQTEISSRTANHEVSNLVSVLQTTVTVLQEQLQVKDQQIAQQAQTIDRLSDALAAAQQTAAAAQALHAGTIQLNDPPKMVHRSTRTILIIFHIITNIHTKKG